MAVGARQSDILQQFLIEAILVCLIGGVLGVLLSLGLGQIIQKFAGDNFGGCLLNHVDYRRICMLDFNWCGVWFLACKKCSQTRPCCSTCQRIRKNMPFLLTRLCTAMLLASTLVGCAAVVKTPYQAPAVQTPIVSFSTTKQHHNNANKPCMLINGGRYW